jgi:hypothetical protein
MTWFIRRLVFALKRGISDTLHGKVVPLPAGLPFPRVIEIKREWW